MPAARRELRRAALVTAVVTVATAAEAVAFAFSGPSGATAVCLVALAIGVLTLYWISRSLDADADRAVRRSLAEHGESRLDQITSDTGLRPATARLSLARLARSTAVTVSGDPQRPVFRVAD